MEMKSEIKTETVITLKLSAEEGYILSQLVQNSQVDPSEESQETSTLREAIFKACKPSGIK